MAPACPPPAVRRAEGGRSARGAGYFPRLRAAPGAYTAAAVAGTSTEARPQRASARPKRWLWPLVAVVVLMMLALAVLLRGHRRFDGYVARTGGTQEHVVRANHAIDLVFVDRERSGTSYQVTYARLSDRQTRRFAARTKGPDQLSRIRLRRPGRPSRVDVRWYVAGRQRARWVFLVRPPKRGE